jgi:hypothetical protein
MEKENEALTDTYIMRNGLILIVIKIYINSKPICFRAMKQLRKLKFNSTNLSALTFEGSLDLNESYPQNSINYLQNSINEYNKKQRSKKCAIKNI